MADTAAEVLYDLLQADVTLAALATGDGYLIDKLTAGGSDKHPINPEDTPDAYATVAKVKRLKPCYTVKTQGRGSGGGRRTYSVRVEVRCYERAGYANTRAMLDRIYVLMGSGEGKVLRTDSGRSYECTHVNDLTTSEDDSIPAGQGKRGASMEATVYECLGGPPR